MRLPSIACVVPMLGLAAPWGRLAAQTPAFPAEAKRVTVDVVVTDREGRPVVGLAREDFVVKENGVPQTIAHFEAVDVSAAAAESEPAPGSPRIATNGDPERAGRTFLVVFDDLNLTRPTAEHTQEALASFLQVHLREGDGVTLAPTSGGAWWSGLIARDRDDLQAALRALTGRRAQDASRERISDHEAMLIEADQDVEAIAHVGQRFGAFGLLGPRVSQFADMEAREPVNYGKGPALVQALAADVYAGAKERNRNSLRMIERGMAALAGGRGRRSVILVSDGFIHDQRLEEFRRVREAARRSNAVLYFLDARGLTGPESGAVEPIDLPDVPNLSGYNSLAAAYRAAESAGAEGLASDTGGFSIRSTNDLAAGLGRISRESRAFYLLGYEPADKRRDGRFRKLQVEVRRAGVEVRARKGYYASAEAKEKTPAGGRDPEVARALDALIPQRDIPLRLAAYVLGRASEGRASVVLAAEADPAALSFDERQGRYAGAVESYSSVAGRESGQVGQRERLLELALTPEVRRQVGATWLPVSHGFELAPGVYQARFVVRDRGSRRTGSVGLRFEVPDLHGLRITTPILTDTLQRAAAGAQPHPIPIARRSFAQGSQLTCGFAVEGARDPLRVRVTYEIRRGDGTVVSKTDPKVLLPDDKGLLASTFRLTAHRPGRYEILLRAKDEASGEEASAGDEFVVEPAAAAAPAAAAPSGTR